MQMHGLVRFFMGSVAGLSVLAAAACGGGKNGEDEAPVSQAPEEEETVVYRTLAFASYADNLVSVDVNEVKDVFLRNLDTGETERISESHDGSRLDGDSFRPYVSADGNTVTFSSEATNLVSNDTNGVADVFVCDRTTGTLSRVSVSSSGEEGDQACGTYLSLSADGQYVAFTSDAANLVENDTNGVRDVFVHNRQTGETFRASLATDSTQGDIGSIYPSLSEDGKTIAFASKATNLADGDTNGMRDIFVRDLDTGVTTLASAANDGTPGNNHAFKPFLSADGQLVTFPSEADNLVDGDTNEARDIFLHDRGTGETVRITPQQTSIVFEKKGSAYWPSISQDGRYIAYSRETSINGIASVIETEHIFLYDRDLDETTKVSLSTAGTAGNGDSKYAVLSADGSQIAFESDADNLVDADGNGLKDIFVRNLQTGETSRENVNSDEIETNDESNWSSLGGF